MITLLAAAHQEYSGQQYVARILGLDPKGTFRYERIGYVEHPNITKAYVVTPGLYAVCCVTSTGTEYENYRIITEREGDLSELSAHVDNLDGVGGQDAAKRIAKRLDAGESIQQIVEVQINKYGSGKYRIRKKTEAEPPGDTKATASKES